MRAVVRVFVFSLTTVVVGLLASGCGDVEYVEDKQAGLQFPKSLPNRYYDILRASYEDFQDDSVTVFVFARSGVTDCDELVNDVLSFSRINDIGVNLIHYCGNSGEKSAVEDYFLELQGYMIDAYHNPLAVIMKSNSLLGVMLYAEDAKYDRQKFIAGLYKFISGCNDVACVLDRQNPDEFINFEFLSEYLDESDDFACLIVKNPTAYCKNSRIIRIFEEMCAEANLSAVVFLLADSEMELARLLSFERTDVRLYLLPKKQAAQYKEYDYNLGNLSTYILYTKHDGAENFLVGADPCELLYGGF